MDAGMIILLIVVFIGGWVLGHITARARAKQLDRPTPPGVGPGVGPGVDAGPVFYPPPDIGTTIHDEQRQAIGAAIAQGRKIEAIKLYREVTGVSLVNAKNAVEAWEARGSLGGSDEWRQLPPENRL